MDPFVHLHVASGYSLQYGASHPHVLVERAAEQEMDTLALTDRDGTYGAVKHARACRAAGLRPVLGVDLAVTPVAEEGARARLGTSAPRTPVRGGAFRDDRALPRVTFLADAGAAGGRAGWAAICRLVSATQLAGERGKPVADLSVLAPWLESGDVTVLLGPASEVGAAAGPAAATTWPGPRWSRGSRSSRGPTSSSSWSPTGCPRGTGVRLGPGHHAPRRADGRLRP